MLNKPRPDPRVATFAQYDFAIRRLAGKVIRALVDDQYWFPASIRADEEAQIGKDERVHVRVTVTYSNYKSR